MVDKTRAMQMNIKKRWFKKASKKTSKYFSGYCPLWAGQMGRILPTLGTNQIAGFVEYHLLMNWEKNKME